MRYAFFGTPEFAALALENLISSGMPPELVVCNPDKPVGRKKIITPPEAKVVALKHGISVAQPEKLKEWDPGEFDFFVVAAYGRIIPSSVLSRAKKGALGIHPSLLPAYRGPSPIQSAMLSDDEKTGVTIYVLDELVDHGPVIAQEMVSIDKKGYFELSDELAGAGARLVAEFAPKWLTGQIQPVPQDHDKATATPFFMTQDGYLDPALPAAKLEKKVRALAKEPGTYFMNPSGKRIKVLRADVSESLDGAEEQPPGSLIKRGAKAYLKCGSGNLELLEVQPEGKKPGPPSMLF